MSILSGIVPDILSGVFARVTRLIISRTFSFSIIGWSRWGVQTYTGTSS